MHGNPLYWADPESVVEGRRLFRVIVGTDGLPATEIVPFTARVTFVDQAARSAAGAAAVSVPATHEEDEMLAEGIRLSEELAARVAARAVAAPQVASHLSPLDKLDDMIIQGSTYDHELHNAFDSVNRAHSCNLMGETFRIYEDGFEGPYNISRKPDLTKPVPEGAVYILSDWSRFTQAYFDAKEVLGLPK